MPPKTTRRFGASVCRLRVGLNRGRPSRGVWRLAELGLLWLCVRSLLTFMGPDE